MRFRLKPYLDLCRISNLPTVWTNVLAAAVVSGAAFSWSTFLVLCFSLSLFYSAGMCLNDLLDVKIDQVHKPFRPLPSRRMSTKEATLFTMVLFAVALSLLLVVPYQRTVYAGLLLLGLIIAYNRIHKRTPMSVFLMAACRLMIFVISALAITATVAIPVWIGGVAQFSYVLLLTLVARFENGMKAPFSFPLIPVMLSGISLLDGAIMAFFASPAWFVAGLLGAFLTHVGQRYVKGD
jgi:4-hydroxybenzoate polyprenyltransferase